jgi:cysteinyl-tRNA synthetase
VIQFFDTATKTKQPLNATTNDEIKIYSCGPTVYDYPHIGNWFSFIRWDLLNRTLLSNGYKTKWVMNITDVGHLVSDADEGEDKLEKGARREGKTAWKVAEFYGDYFISALKKLNFSTISSMPKATDYIKEQIALVEKLVKAGYTYRVDDGVYFDTSKFPQYANFAKLDVANLSAGQRVSLGSKEHATDFALWKLSPAGSKRDMEWDSPWGTGFPGWHLECSAMIHSLLGEPIDIHAGGIDHIPVHHTNEIAQTVAGYGKPLAKIWLHGNFVLVENKKMSKSLGNFLTLEDILSEGYSLSAFRLLVMSSHYRTEANFSRRILQSATNRLKNYQNFADIRWQLSKTNSNHDFKAASLSILEEVNDDLNSPQALAKLDTFISTVEAAGIGQNQEDSLAAFIMFLEDLFGLSLGESKDITKSQHATLSQRAEARRGKDFLASDKLREQLEKEGISVKDTTSGEQRWTRI